MEDRTIGRNILLPEDFEKYDFLGQSKRESHSRNRLRLLAMSHLQDGKSLLSVANLMKVHWTTVQSWLRRFRENGFAGLLESPRSGAPKKLNKEHENFIREKVETLSKNSTGGYITGKDLHKMLSKQLQTKCCLRTVYNTLHRLNFSWITARSKHQHSNYAVQEEYKKNSQN